MTNEFNNLTIGLLALQGDYALHERQLDALGVKRIRVKLPRDLELIDALIMPGGESTTMNILIERFGLREPLAEFARQKPVYGTCAGMILLAKEIVNNQAKVRPFGLIDIDVERNAWGRQVFSFEETLEVALGNGRPEKIVASFIRAPKIRRVGADVEVLSKLGDEIVLVEQGHILAASFHAEVETDSTLLRYFLKKLVADKPT